MIIVIALHFYMEHAFMINLGITTCISPENTRRWNAGFMLGQRRRRWSNIKPPLAQRLVLAERTAVAFGILYLVV